jgi:hypothetical protein
MERSCQAQLLAEATGSKPVCIDSAQADVTRGQIGTSQGGWFSFQPLWENMLRKNPDVLD